MLIKSACLLAYSEYRVHHVWCDDDDSHKYIQLWEERETCARLFDDGCWVISDGQAWFVQELELGVNRTSFLKFCFIYLPEIGRNVILGVGDLKFWRIISHGGFDCIGLLCTNTSIQTHAQWHRQVFDYVKVKVNIKVRICIALHCELTSEALRYGSHSCYTAKHTIPAFTT